MTQFEYTSLLYLANLAMYMDLCVQGLRYSLMPLSDTCCVGSVDVMEGPYTIFNHQKVYLIILLFFAAKYMLNTRRVPHILLSSWECLDICP